MTSSGNDTRQPTLFIPHGGGPCFFMDPPPNDPHAWDAMAAYLRGIAASLPAKPRAILVISAHWETPRPTVMTAAHPPMLFDYYGFPEHTYKLEYPAPGSPELASRVRALLADAGIASDADDARGYDHGVFVPFLLMFPDADIPIVQLSLRGDLDPAAHIAIGRALAPLRDEGVLIVGSGMSYHNLRRFWSTRVRCVARGGCRFDRHNCTRGEARRMGQRARRTHRASAQRTLAAADGRCGRRRQRCRPSRLRRSRIRQGRFRVPVRLGRESGPKPGSLLQ